MLPKLVYLDSKECHGNKESVWWFLEQSLKHHKAPVLETLFIRLGPRCPVNVNVGELISVAVHRMVCNLSFALNWLSKPITLPESLYICDTLVDLRISDKILVDVPYSVCLPNLKTLALFYVVYRDDDSLVRLLSGCHILRNLIVVRHKQDGMKNCIVKVPSLKMLFYTNLGERVGNMVGSLVIDFAALSKITIQDFSRDDCSIVNSPRLDRATIKVFRYLDDKFWRSISSVMYLDLVLTVETIACCAINFSRLIECTITPFGFDWLEPFMCFLQNSPKLKVLQFDQTCMLEDLPLSFNPPSSVPGCLSNHLEIFEWKEYRGRNAEKEVIRYILANSKCLKIVGISIRAEEDDEKRKKMMMTELESMSRVSTSSQLLFSTHFGNDISFQDEWSDGCFRGSY